MFRTIVLIWAGSLALFAQNSAAPDLHDVHAQAELIRSLLAGDEYRQANTVALAAHQANPADAQIRVLTGDTFFRMGQLENAYRFYLAAIGIDPGNARAYLGAARVHAVSFRRRSMKASLDKALALDPSDPAIRAGAARLLRNDPVQIVSGYHPYRIQIEREKDGPRRELGAAVHVSFNGRKPVVLTLDTGASGILIGEKTAERAGIAKIRNGVVMGIGDHGPRNAAYGVAAHMKVDDLELADVPVDIVERSFGVGSEGLIGLDVFERFLIRLDLPHADMALEPLAGEDGTAKDWLSRDAIAPSDGSWLPARHSGSHMFIPAVLNQKRATYFLIDTGSGVNAVAESVVPDVSKTDRQDYMLMKGVSGRVENLHKARADITVAFGALRQKNQDLIVLNLEDLSRSAGMEVGGILGWQALSHLAVTLNYRDGLVRLEYIPPPGQ